MESVRDEDNGVHTGGLEVSVNVRRSGRLQGEVPQMPGLDVHRKPRVAKENVPQEIAESEEQLSWKSTASENLPGEATTGLNPNNVTYTIPTKTVRNTSIKSKSSYKDKAEKMRSNLKKYERLATLEEEMLKLERELEEDDSSQNLDDEDESESILKEFLEVPQENLEKNARMQDWVEKLPEPGKTSSIEHLAQVLAETIKANVELSTKTLHKSENSNNIDKFLARQSTARDLPRFNGDPQEWPTFHSRFKQSTEACNFTNVENMARLEKSLGGRARESVAAMLMLPENCDQVIDTLQMKFGRPSLIINCLIEKATNLKSPVENRPETIIDFSCAITNLVSIMESMNQMGHMKNPHLMDKFVDKLPFHLKHKWGKVVVEKGDDLTLKDFSSWIKLMARRISAVETPANQSQQNHHDNKPFKKNFKNEGIYSTVENKSREKKCLYCENSHYLTDCKSFTELDDVKRWDVAKAMKICFSCLKPGHRNTECKRKQPCGVNGCKCQHHKILHCSVKPVINKETIITKEPAKEVDTTEESSNSIFPSCGLKKNVYLQVLPVTLTGPKGKINTYAMLDGGATVTLLKSFVADELGLDGEPHNLDLQFVNSNKKIDSKLVTLNISGETGKEFILHNVQTTDNLNLPVKSTNIQKLAEKWDYLKKIRLNDIENVQPTLLIGNDNANLIVSREVIDGPGNSPVLSRTKLGWVFHGNASHFKGRVDNEFLLHTWNKEENDDIVQLMKMNYSTESFGVRVTAEKPRSKENIKSQEIMDATIKRIGNRFETGLLWRDEHPILPESKAVSLKRLYGMERKMDRDKIFEEKYCEKIQDYVLKGYARKLSPEEASIPKDNIWYLPHFGVINVNKPGKLRFVFDAAAKSNGKSLNDFLMTGPDQLCSLVGVLFKFRQYKIGFSGDIAEMFHQVRVRKEDCPAQRFLWRENDKTKPPDVYEMSVMTFGASCSPSLAQEVKNKNAKEFNDEFPDATKAIINRHYVDDYLDSCDTEKEAIESIRSVREVHRRGGFEIRGWASSSKNVLQAVSENNIDSNETKEMNLEFDLPMERVLGMKWNPNTDVFTFNCKYEKIDEELLNGIKRPTKREMLKIVMSIFDPLGFLCNFTVKAKINLQDVWRTGIGWDDEIQEDNFNKWKKWLIELKRIQEIEISRNYSPRMGISNDVTLHIFCDASQQAFDAVAYFAVNGNEKVDVGFVMAKSRVAPLRPLSIPRLELQAAVMASRLYLLIIEEHEIKINRVVFWSDSTTVLYWLRSDARRYKPFVSHRIGEIMENCDVADWKWVPTDENVADEATRDNKDVDFSKTSRWLNGPSFLKLPEDKWPQEPNVIKIDNTISECELKTEFINFISEEATCLLDISKYSSYTRLLRIAGWILRFVNRCKKMENTHESLLPAEIIMAEKVLLKNVQTESFANEIQDLLKGKNVCKSSKLFTLSPIIDEDGIVRVKGRTLKSPEMNDETKRPVILDSKHPFTKLLIKFYHKTYAHQGQELVMNELRQKYWIISLRVAVKKVWKNCQVCRIVKAKPVTPEMGNLPKERITKYVRPFTMVGMDYFGPYEVTIGRRREKRYGVLFSCLTTRAVHLELSHSLSTDSAIMAITRMISRRGCPTEIFSDNGTNLKGADVEMKKAIESLNQQKILENLTTKGITWKFIPPSSPHMAGAWERLVQSVKRSLKTILKEQAPREETLQTLFAEVENIVNSRPLTFVSNDPNDLQSITPNNFLIGTTSGTPIMGNFTEDKLCTRKQWIIAQNLAENFWKRWIKEYLPTLTKRTKWHLATKPIKEGDLVFIADGTLFKNHWPRGIVTATYPGADGVIRVVDVKTQYGILRRPVVKLCIIDVDQDGV